jgi:hypothetical protein
MPQSRRMSFIEASVSTAIGYFTALATQMIVFPIFAIKVTLTANIAIGLIFTVISIVRSYLVRRLFNAIRGF